MSTLDNIISGQTGNNITNAFSTGFNNLSNGISNFNLVGSGANNPLVPGLLGQSTVPASPNPTQTSPFNAPYYGVTAPSVTPPNANTQTNTINANDLNNFTGGAGGGNTTGGVQYNAPDNSASNAFIQSLTGINNNADENYNNQSSAIDSALRDYGTLSTEIGGKGQYQNDQANAFGLSANVTKLNDINTQIAQKVGEYNQGIAQIGNDSIFGGFAEGEKGRLNNVASAQIGALSSIAQALQGNISTAQSLAQKATDLKFAPLEADLANKKTILENLGTKLGYAEAEKITAKQNLISAKKDDYNNALSTLQQAIQNGAPQDIVTKLATDPNLTYAQVLSTVPNQYIGKDKFAVAPYGGQIYNTITGQVQSAGTSSPSGVVGAVSPNGIINGYNITSYATDPNHESAVNNLYNNITGIAGGSIISDAKTAQSVISNLSPNSPITGQMVLDSANKYGVDPNLMIALMAQDSSLQTKGLALSTNNPGNVGNDDAGNTKKFPTLQAGVDAVANWLSNHNTSQQVADISKNYNIALSPEQVSKFENVPDFFKANVAGVLTNTKAIADIPATRGIRDQVLNYAKLVDPSYDELKAKAGQTFLSSKGTQTFIANANTASATVATLADLSSKVDRSNLQLLNNGLLALKKGTGNKATSDLITAYNLTADELGKVLGSGAGSDFAIKLGQSLIDPTLSKDQVASQAKLIQGRIANKLSEYASQGNQGTSTSTSGAGSNASAGKIIEYPKGSGRKYLVGNDGNLTPQ